jgi:hypothetical protein
VLSLSHNLRTADCGKQPKPLVSAWLVVVSGGRSSNF